jgi:hypothetical protein
MDQDPLPASRSCHGNHEGKEGMEWKVSRESLITMGWLPTGQTSQTLWYRGTELVLATSCWKEAKLGARDVLGHLTGTARPHGEELVVMNPGASSGWTLPELIGIWVKSICQSLPGWLPWSCGGIGGDGIRHGGLLDSKQSRPPGPDGWWIGGPLGETRVPGRREGPWLGRPSIP